MKKTSIIVNVAFAAISLAASAGSFAADEVGKSGVVNCVEAPCSDAPAKFASIGALTAGGYELSLGREIAIFGYQSNISLLFGDSKADQYAGLHLQSAPLGLNEKTQARLGLGIAKTSTDGEKVISAIGGSVWNPNVAKASGGAGSHFSPFVSLDVSYALAGGVQAFANAKWFSNFSENNSSSGKTYAGIGLRVAF